MTWHRINPAPAVQVTPATVHSAITSTGKTVREANGLMYQAKRAAKAAKRDGNPIPPVLQVGGQEFLWRHGNTGRPRRRQVAPA